MKNVFNSLISFILGVVFCFYFIVYSLMETSVARVHLLSSNLYQIADKAGAGETRESVTPIIYDDINFYTRYRDFYPRFLIEKMDMILCMSVRDDPSNYDTTIYFSLINNPELESLIANHMGYCIGR